MDKVMNGDEYGRWQNADMIIQVSDGNPRIHSDGKNWDVIATFFIFGKVLYRALDGEEFLEKTKNEWRFSNYPVVFSETCHAGRLNSTLMQAFTNSSCLYIASTTTTSNATERNKWEEFPNGDGVKYGIADLLDERDSMFMIYRNVINRIIDNLPNEEKIRVSDVLSGYAENWNDVMEILTFTMYGLDRPSPVKKRGKPKKIGEIEDL